MSDALKSRKRYPSDLTDEQWAILEPLAPPARQNRGGRPRDVNLRDVIDAIMYINRSGCQWDMLPHDFPPKSTDYEYFALCLRILPAVLSRTGFGFDVQEFFARYGNSNCLSAIKRTRQTHRACLGGNQAFAL